MGPSEINAVLTVLLGGLALVLVGGALLWVMRVFAPPWELGGDGAELLVLAILGWILIASGLAAGGFFVCFVLAGPLGFVLAVVGLLVLGMALLRHHRTQQYTLLSTLAVAAERLMPLAPAVEAFADERGGLMGRRARRLAALLRAGFSLPDALYRTPGLISRQAQVTIRVGQESGALADALNDVVNSHELHAPVWNQTVGRALYLCGLILFACLIATFMMLKIAPQFRMISEEFDAQMPVVTQWLFGASHIMSYYWPIFGLGVLILVVGFALLGIQYMAGVRWSLPGVNWLTQRLDTAVILEALALAAERNVAFPGEIETLARWYPRGPIRRRLGAVLRDLKAGVDWSQSLARWGLIQPVELAVFQAAGRAGNLPWALREMAESNRRRLNYRLYAWVVQVLFPLTILAFGLLVMVYIVAYFMPLISLIENLT